MPRTRSLNILRLPERRWTIIIVAIPLLGGSTLSAYGLVGAGSVLVYYCIGAGGVLAMYSVWL